MTANELRIGNLVTAKSPERQEWESPVVVTIGYLEMFTTDKVHFKPLPLTEEWLQKLGFEQVRNCYLVRNGFEAGLDGNDFVNGMWTIIIAKKLPVKVKYVHQLQNLYFALTGEELTLKQ